jgi:2-C-methyl-D-erythritol 2,4-cyclodiphosphate synthase
MLRYVADLALVNGYGMAWIDSTILAERPRLAPYGEAMREAMSRSGIPSGIINIKAKTDEGMGFVGRGEGIAAYAVCLLKKLR